MPWTPLTRHAAVAWYSICLGVAALLLYQGVGYLIGGAQATTSPGWHVLLALLPGGIRTHGGILFGLGLGLAVEARAPFDKVMRVVLWALRFYSLLVAGCWFGSWWLDGVNWSAPGWWLFLAGLSFWLSAFAPRRPVLPPLIPLPGVEPLSMTPDEPGGPSDDAALGG